LTELDPGEEPMQRAVRTGSACMLARALPLRLVEKDVRPADRAELEWGIEHGSTFVGTQVDRATPSGAGTLVRPATKPV